MRSQRSALFRAPVQLFGNRMAIYNRRMAQLHAEVVGLEVDIRARDLQLYLLEEERHGAGALVGRGHEGKMPSCAPPMLGLRVGTPRR